MRVAEFATKVRAPVIEVLNQAEMLEIEVYSSFSQLDPDDVSALESAFAQKDKAEVTQVRKALDLKRKQKLATSAEKQLADNKLQWQNLEANRIRALKMYEEARGITSEEVPAISETPSVAVTEELIAEAPVAETPVTAKVPAEKKSAAKKPATPAPVPEKSAKPEKPVRTTPVMPESDDDEYDDELGTKYSKRAVKAEIRPKTRATRSTLAKKSDDKVLPQRTKAPVAKPKPAAQTVVPIGTKSISPDKIILLRGAVLVKELAEKLNIRPNRLIADLMQMNILASINQRVELDVAQRLADKYGFKVELERQKRSVERKPTLRSTDADDDIPVDMPELCLPRPPVITFLGHVDHGKTSLMDRIRNTKVVTGEAGGITQHIGAYSVELNGRKITFLDTPGHAAFSAMRARGANLTDIAVIIIAADDGIMPQTREAIKHAQQAGVQIMVAINKCDLPTTKPERVRQMLQAEGLTPEEWGGDIICTEVSAHSGQGVDHLLEMILLQADMLELSANPNRRADGYVLEAQLEQGLGPTATLLITGGTLKVGDIVLCGEYFGKIRGLINDRGRRVKSASPAIAVKCMGLSGVPEAGAHFRVMLNDRRARELAAQAAEERRQIQLAAPKATSLDALMLQIQDNLKLELEVIIKADTQGSAEAVCESLREIKSEKVSLNIISEAIGNISATDINKATTSNAIVVGFNVGVESGVQQLARHHGIRVASFKIIYELLDFITQRMLDLLPPEYKEVTKGHAEIRAIFDIGKMGKVAGCQMLDGSLLAKEHFRVLRNKENLWEGKLKTLKHFQTEVAEVSGSQECGIAFTGFEDFAEGDVVQCFALEELPRML